MTHQTENGYTRIADTLLDALALADLSKREYKICLVVIRRTYGFGKREALLSAGFIGEATGLERANTARTISAMVQRGILTAKRTQNGNVIGLNKRFFPSVKTDTTGSVKTDTPDVYKTDTTLVSKQTHKRETFIDTSIDTPPTPPAKKTRQKKKLPDPPQWLDPEAWDQWIQHRKEIRKPLTPSQVEAQFRKLDKFRAIGDDPTAVIDQSIAGGWQGLFPVKPNGANGNGKRFETAHERMQRACAEYASEPAEGDEEEGAGTTVDSPGWHLRR